MLGEGIIYLTVCNVPWTGIRNTLGPHQRELCGRFLNKLFGDKDPDKQMGTSHLIRLGFISRKEKEIEELLYYGAIFAISKKGDHTDAW